VLQVYTCEQVLSYLRQFVPSEKVVAEERKEVEAPAPGMKLLTRKNDEADAMYSVMGGKKGKGARKAAEKQKLSTETIKVGQRARCCVLLPWVVVVCALFVPDGYLGTRVAWCRQYRC
jgi:hypothetical protein